MLGILIFWGSVHNSEAQEQVQEEGAPPPEEKENVGFAAMALPLAAGLLAALRRLVARTLGRVGVSSLPLV